MKLTTTAVGLLSGFAILLSPGLDSLTSKMAKCGMLAYATTLGVVWLRDNEPEKLGVQDSIAIAQARLNEQASHLEQIANSRVDRASQEVEYWRSQYLASNAPILPLESWTTSGHVCICIQQALFQLGLTVDCNREQPGQIKEPKGGHYYIVNLYFRGQKDLITYLDNKAKIVPILEHALGGSGSFVIAVEGKCLQIRYDPAKQSSIALYKDARVIKSRTLDEIMALGVGYLICGNSGSGKTSVAKYIAGQYTEAKGIIIDVHASANNWDDIGGQLVSEPSKIFETVAGLRDEYNRRKDTPKPSQGYERLVVIWDEFEECLDDLTNYLDLELELSNKEIQRELTRITTFVRSLATGGRKYGITLMVLNQSWNVSSLKINSGHRKNFVCIFLNAEADRFLVSQSDNSINLDTSRYRAVATGAVETQVLEHPTHHSYKKVANLQPPTELPRNLLHTT
jgi:energy-coupling factor transporter ATP-binding protein EcfA2